ncbi:hypothetical protein PV08_11009 [Exophiala spinifera]|uniref:Major facilitator superfamily (MFS) profile domain-containing protein n=1 Tax=Exophiala spinifera TaxID=91928 RepID=A0A0D1ZFB9_9EURO|nr:uncharacterized protein PV08_11009 [Exophiala spinifera]KIW11707.1 hypothetical protein PV08_11009 [Exophiala spinifera]
MSHQDPSEAIAKTLQELEHLLSEAVKLAGSAGIVDGQDRAEDWRQASAMLTSAQSSGKSEQPSEKPSRGMDVGPDGGDDELRLIPPEPMDDHQDDRTPRTSSVNQIQQPSKLPGPSRTSFRRKSTQLTGFRRTAIRPSPIIRLHDIDLNEDDSDDKGGLLRGLENSDLPRAGHERHFTNMFGVSCSKVDLNGARHVDIDESPADIDVHKTCHHAPVARNWPDSRKRFAAAVACVNAACLGLTVGIYAGEVPAIQYVIVDLNRRMIFGNVLFYCGLIIPTLVCWPLPLLHGRKPYNVAAIILALCLQIPQGVMVISFRSPDVDRYRVVLLWARGMSGFAFGFANINNLATLLDVFGASLQSSRSHEASADPYDVRRHGGGMGVWLAIWTWCTTGSIAVGFVIGAFIISGASVDWGFWTSLLLLMGALLLNVIAPEVRRSAFRRTLAEVIGEGGSFSRVARGEVKLHLTGNGPYWWGEEIKAGLHLSWKMIRQPGFLILSVYTAWTYAQFTLILMLLGALTSTLYRYRPIDVGLCVLSLAIGSALAIPFEKASWFSRARYYPPRTDSMTFQRSLPWNSHTLRRALVMVVLPLAAISYGLTSRGPAFPVAAPCVFAALVAYASTLAIGECYALIMQNFDVSDLQPGMTGRPVRNSISMRYREQRTNFTCYPRVSAGVAVTQSLEFVFGAASVGICGRVERKVGAMQAALIVAGILMALTLLLISVLIRRKTAQMIPSTRKGLDDDNEGWEPVVLGHPSGLTRKISLLESGGQTRFSEIRRRNKLDASLTGR